MQPTSPTVSVLMPARDRAAYVRAAAESVLAQTFTDLELIVVDDGSTDGTAEIVRRIEDPRVRVIETAPRGISTALNEGLGAARGRFVARLDSDDLWLPQMLETLLEVLSKRPDVGLAYARCEFMSHDGTPLGGARGLPLPDPANPLRSLLRTDYTASISSVFPRDLLVALGGWDGSLVLGEDWDLALRVARERQVVFVDRLVARIRRHDANTVRFESPGFEQRLHERARVLDRLFADASLRSDRALRAVAYRNLHTGAGMQMLGMRRYRDAWTSFRAALRAGGNPLITLSRIAWTACNWFVLSRSSWASRVAIGAVRRLRHRPPSASAGDARRRVA